MSKTRKRSSFINILIIPAFLAAAALFVAAGISVLRWLRLFLPGLPGFVFWIVFIGLTLSISLSYMLPKGRLSVYLHRIGEVWTWVFLYLLVFVLIAGIVRLFWPQLPFKQTDIACLPRWAAVFRLRRTQRPSAQN